MSHAATLTLNPSIDESTTTDHVAPEQKTRCAHPRYDPGGGGINVSRAMCHLGSSAPAVYAAAGVTGRMLAALLQAEGTPHVPVTVSGDTRINVHVEENATGNQYRFTMPGPEMSDAEADACVDATLAISPAPDYLIASGSLPPGAPADVWARLARRASGKSRVVVDTSGEPLRLALDAGVYLVKPNQRELSELVGRDLSTDAAVAESARELVRSGKAAIVVVSMGAAGMIAASEAGCIRVEAPQVHALSTVGAGDSALAGIMVRLVAGADLSDVVRFGVAAGSAATLSEGTQLCHLPDVERLFAGTIARDI